MTSRVRKRCRTDPASGCAPADRDLAAHVEWGIVPLDKPAGTTSRRAAEAVRRLLGASRVGHGGTLDPMVTGVLPLLLGRTTRIADMFLMCEKVYTGVMRLHGEVGDDDLAAAVSALSGRIEQMPPRRSRVRRRPRMRTVHEFVVTGRDGREATFRIRCERGTYVRKLIHDLGERLGFGAHMARLRRTEAGGFAGDECVTMEALARAAAEGDEQALRAAVRPAEQVVSGLLPCVWIDDGAVHAVCAGQPLAVPGICSLDDWAPGDRVAVLSAKGELVGLGEAQMGSEDVLRAERGVAVRVRPVLMSADTYPRLGQP